MGDRAFHKFIERGAHKGKGLAVFTSGGDSQVGIKKIKHYLFQEV